MKFNVPVAVMSCLLVAGLAVADDAKKPQPSAEENAAMEAMMRAATPGDAHKQLAPFVGDFNVQVTMWMAPGAPPQTSKGTTHNTWALGKRWVEQRFTGTFNGMPFNGIGFTGYDNVKKAYVGTWMDSFSTSVMLSTGQREGDGKYTFEGSMDDPMTGKPAPVKEVITVADNDHHTMEMWGPDPSGQMFRMMEIRYTRKKK